MARFILVVVYFILAGCGATPTVERANLTEGVKYNVETFNFDLVYRLNVAGYLPSDQTGKVVRQSFERVLSDAGLIAEDGDKNVVDITVYIDYRRIFTGEATPFPLDSIAPPSFFISAYAQQEGRLKTIYNSDESVVISNGIAGFVQSLAGVHVTGNPEKDIIYSMTVGKAAAERLIRSTPGFSSKFKANEIVVDKKDVDGWLQLNVSTERIDYIPNDVVAGYLASMRSNEYKERLQAYKQLQGVWMNSPELYQYLQQKIESNYLNELSYNEKSELKQQIKTLSFSGMLTFNSFLESLADNAIDESVRRSAKAAIDTLKEKALYASLIHRPLPSGVNLDWQQQQLYNMTTSKDIYLQRRAVKQIYSRYGENKFLLDALSENLNDALRKTYRSRLSVDYHAWICRTLGKSGKVKYKAQLENIAEYAYYEKVREYAEDFADLL
jgi:hypothetical protein